MKPTGASAVASRFPTFARMAPAARWIKWSLLLLFGALVLYFLSFGPAIRMAQNRAVSIDTVMSIYSPLETIAYVIPGAHRLLVRYVELWSMEEPQ